jgi:hypothetical protein
MGVVAVVVAPLGIQAQGEPVAAAAVVPAALGLAVVAVVQAKQAMGPEVAELDYLDYLEMALAVQEVQFEISVVVVAPAAKPAEAMMLLVIQYICQDLVTAGFLAVVQAVAETEVAVVVAH